MAGDIGARIERLVQEHYPWGGDGFLPRPAGGAPECIAQLKAWIRHRVAPYGRAALTLIALVRPILDDLDQQVQQVSGRRWLARVDALAIVKEPQSVLEKMAREWKDEQGAPPIGFDSFTRDIRDLGRFRIVANFLSDVERITQALEMPYDQRTATTCSSTQRDLATEFALDGHSFEDSIEIDPAERKKGERCRKGIFLPRNGHAQLHVEVQVQTQLQESWDKKDHFLLYEPRRLGVPVSPQHEREMFAMSELLFVADLTFDRLRTAIQGDGGDGGVTA